ncbi:MAG TPA: hypothetical protein P5244_02855 [Syntrophales bacterium]|nr:hypothetical protein [Syntrophales bacterium]
MSELMQTVETTNPVVEAPPVVRENKLRAKAEARAAARGKTLPPKETKKQAEKAKKKSAFLEEIRGKKMIEVANPMAIVINPTTREGHTLTKIGMRYDKVINRMRISGGVYVSITKVANALEKVKELHANFGKVIMSMSDGMGIGGYMTAQMETQEARTILAQRSSSYVYLPRTMEGREFMQMVKMLDPLLVRLRTTCTDYEKVGPVIIGVLNLIVEANRITMKMARVVGISYEPLKDMNWVRKYLGVTTETSEETDENDT